MEKIPEKIAEKLTLLPDHPGIYLWKNAEVK
jgi:excinuclease UvrABC nuclease subunit